MYMDLNICNLASSECNKRDFETLIDRKRNTHTLILGNQINQKGFKILVLNERCIETKPVIFVFKKM